MTSFRSSAIVAAAFLSTTAIAFAADSAAAKLTDAQIAQIAVTAGTVDIDNAKVAVERAQSKSVREFARDMIKDHTAINNQALALVKKLGVTPEDSDASQTLAKQGVEKRDELSKLSGAAFDRAYADNEVAYHKSVDNTLAKQLIPDASNPQLKSFLKTGLRIFRGHEHHAEHMLKQVERLSSI